MWTTPDPPSTPFVAASNWSGTGEVNTAPGHAASSMPRPTSPPCMGSCPDPPPDTSPTFPDTGASARYTTMFSTSTRRLGWAAAMPRRASVTMSSGALMSFFIARFSFRCTRCVVPLRRAALRRPAVARPALVASLRRLHRVTLGGGLLQRELRDHLSRPGLRQRRVGQTGQRAARELAAEVGPDMAPLHGAAEDLQGKHGTVKWSHIWAY